MFYTHHSLPKTHFELIKLKSSPQHDNSVPIMLFQTCMTLWKHLSKYHILCPLEEKKSYRFGTTWGWKHDRFHFGVNCHLQVFSTPTAKNKAVCVVYIFSWLFLPYTLQTVDQLECITVWISEKLPFATFAFRFIIAMNSSCLNYKL